MGVAELVIEFLVVEFGHAMVLWEVQVASYLEFLVLASFHVDK